MTTKVGWLSLLGVAFVVLKITGHLAWSWWWVLAPFWGPPAAVALFTVATIVFVLVAERGP